MTKATRKGKTLIDLIDHVTSNVHNKLIHRDVINTDEISDHDDTRYTFQYNKGQFE